MNNKKLLIAYLIPLLLFSGITLAAPVSTLFRNVLPETSGTYDLGTSTARWLTFYDATSTENVINTGTLTATTSITTNNLTVNGTCTGCGTGTINSGTTNRFSYYSGATTLDSANGFQLNVANGSTTFPTLNVGVITATTTGNYLGDLTLGVKLPNTQLANSTISGVALGGTLNALTALNTTLTFSGSYTGAAAQTVALNLNTQNTWTASSTFPVVNMGVITSTSTGNYLGDLSLGVKLPNAQLANSTISGIALGSNLANLTATNGTLTFSATYNGSAAATIGLNLNQQNTWTASSTHPVLNTGTLTATSSLTTNNLFATASTTITAPITLQGSATSTQDFTVLGKFANKQGSSTVNMTGVTLIDFNALGTRQKWIMSGATQLVLNATSSNPLAGMTFLIDICNGSGSVLTFVTPQALRWDGTNGTTTFTSTANQHQMFWGYYDGVTSMNHIVGSSTPTICL